MEKAHRTRLAPSPTGALHLGNARTFLVNWALARQQGWDVLLRIEDLDGPRVKRGAAEQAIELLAWLGIDWDEGPVYQSHDLQPYRRVLKDLADKHVAYVCHCTRSEIEAASRSAPHGDEHELRYPGTCRKGEPPALGEMFDFGWRIKVAEGEHRFVDEFAGFQAIDIQQTVGDFQIWTKQALPSYQLAVVVDDHRQGIDRIVRGDDLLSSTPRQQWIAQQMGMEDDTRYWHLPIVRGNDGRRLAKRHGDTRLSHYRAEGVSPQRVIGLLAAWCGMREPRELTAPEFARRFALDRLPTEDVVFTAEDEAWLVGTGKA